MPWFLNDDFEKDDWSDICVVVWEYIDKVADDNGQAKVDYIHTIFVCCCVIHAYNICMLLFDTCIQYLYVAV